MSSPSPLKKPADEHRYRHEHEEAREGEDDEPGPVGRRHDHAPLLDWHPDNPLPDGDSGETEESCSRGHKRELACRPKGAGEATTGGVERRERPAEEIPARLDGGAGDAEDEPELRSVSPLPSVAATVTWLVPVRSRRGVSTHVALVLPGVGSTTMPRSGKNSSTLRRRPPSWPSGK